jgi:hypothetical protein
MSLTINEPEVIAFYQNHPEISFKDMNLNLVRCLQNSISWDSTPITETVKLQSNFFEMKAMLNKMQNSMEDTQNNMRQVQRHQTMTNENLESQLKDAANNARAEYLQNIKDLLEMKSLTDQKEFDSSVEKQNEILMNKVTLQLNEMIPKGHATIHTSINELRTALTHETDKLKSSLNTNDKNDALCHLVNNFDSNMKSILSTNNTSIMNLMAGTEQRIHSKLEGISSKQTTVHETSERMHTTMQDHFDKYKNSNRKGAMGENLLHHLLCEEFPDAEIINTSGVKRSCDLLIKREGYDDIRIENKDYDTNVPPREVSKFERDIEENNCHGIFLSQSSGISGRKDFQMNNHNGKLVVYLHNVRNDIKRVHLMVNCIDQQAMGLARLQKSTDGQLIKPDMLKVLQKEYNDWDETRREVISHVRDSSKKTIDMLNNAHMENISKLFINRITISETTSLTCSICKVYKGKNESGLKKHMASCQKKANEKSICSVET